MDNPEIVPGQLPAPQGHIRLSDDEREHALVQLRSAMNDGRLTLFEYEDRAELVFAASTRGDLTPILHDLPEDLAVGRGDSRQLPVVPNSGRSRWCVQIMGGAEQHGMWDPGSSTKSITIMGGQLLDLTDVAATEVNITAFTLMGATEIIVPDDAVVDCGGFMLFGGISNQAGRPTTPRMRVRVRAWGGMGGCEIRTPSDSEQASGTLTQTQTPPLPPAAP